MIIKKIRRQAPARSPNSAEFAYLSYLSRYIVRADIEDLQELARISNDDYLRDLARYAVAEGREGAALASGGLNLHGATLADWQAELAALLHRCPDSAGAIDHWVFSWPDGEKPTVPEAERVIQIFMECQGLKRCKGAWGFHVDTDNPHVHLAAVRIDPKTGARMTAGDGWDIDAAHRAKAVIEAEFKWIPEPRSRYLVRDRLLIERASNRVLGDAGDPASWARHRAKSVSNGGQPALDHPAIDSASLAYEEETGFMSRKRIAVEIAVPIVLKAATLDAAHAALAKQGIELGCHLSGAAFVISGKKVKASIDRRTSLSAIEARFDGRLTPSPYKPVVVPPRERWAGDERRRTYYAVRRPHDERLSGAAADVRTAIGGLAKGDAFVAALNAAVMSAAFPSFDAWQAGQQAPDPTDVILTAVGYGSISVTAIAPPANIEIALSGFKATPLAGRVVYRSIGERGTRPAFVDLGHKVLVHASTDRAAVRASLLLLASRFPDNRVAVTGDEAFQSLVLQIANDEGIVLDGALGRRQSRQAMPDNRGAIPVNREMLKAVETSAETRTPVPLKEPKLAQSPDLILQMLGRLFHGADWNTDEYCARIPAENMATGPARAARSVEEVPRSYSGPASPARQAAVDQVRRVAIAAAAMSR